MKTTTNITYPAFALFAFACFALSPQARAVCQQGCVGFQNTALGNAVLISNTSGVNNTGIGSESLSSNTSGLDNTGVGSDTLTRVTTGARNTAVGASALFANTGWYNSALGTFALERNTSGYYNSAVGDSALFANTTGGSNAAIGNEALLDNTTGNDNTAIGFDALVSNTTGSNNIAIGVSAGQNISTGGNNIDVGNSGVGGDSNTIRIGTEGTQIATFIAGIVHSTLAVGVPVIINPGGRLGISTSSERFKEAIKPMDDASEAILALKPVSFRYKKDLDPEGIPQFGLVAEQVAKVNPDLVARDEEGKPYTVRYEAVNAMLLNEFLKEHKKVEQLQVTLAQQQKGFDATIAKQQKQIEALTAGLEKVSAQLELSKSAPQTVQDNQ